MFNREVDWKFISALTSAIFTNLVFIYYEFTQLRHLGRNYLNYWNVVDILNLTSFWAYIIKFIFITPAEERPVFGEVVGDERDQNELHLVLGVVLLTSSFIVMLNLMRVFE